MELALPNSIFIILLRRSGSRCTVLLYEVLWYVASVVFRKLTKNNVIQCLLDDHPHTFWEAHLEYFTNA